MHASVVINGSVRRRTARRYRHGYREATEKTFVVAYAGQGKSRRDADRNTRKEALEDECVVPSYCVQQASRQVKSAKHRLRAITVTFPSLKHAVCTASRRNVKLPMLMRSCIIPGVGQSEIRRDAQFKAIPFERIDQIVLRVCIQVHRGQR